MYNFDLKRLTPIIYVISVLLLLIIIFKVLIFLLPFVLAAIIVKILTPLFNKIGKEKNILKNIILLIFYAIFAIIFFIVIFKIALEGYNLTNTLINEQSKILKEITNLLGEYETFTLKLPEYSNAIINSIIEKVLTYLNRFALGILNSGISLIKNLPKMVVFVVIMVLSSFIILKDKEKIMKFVRHQFPDSWIEIGYKIKNDVLKYVFNYIKTQCILIGLCFFELFIGLSIISFYTNIKYVLLLTIIIALIDALPILGAGSILIPWILIEIFTKNYILSLSLLVLYVIIFLMRQYAEPKLISNGAGMHPLLTLIALYSGFKIFGVLGFLYGPIIAAIMRIVFAEEIKYGFFKYLINSKGKKNE